MTNSNINSSSLEELKELRKKRLNNVKEANTIPEPETIGSAAFLKAVGKLLIFVTLVAIAGISFLFADSLSSQTLVFLASFAIAIPTFVSGCFLVGFAHLIQTNSNTAHYIQYMTKN